MQIAVPGNWECQGFGIPIYTNFQYPWPVTPPWVPEQNPTGCYRLWFDVPESFSRDRCADMPCMHVICWVWAFIQSIAMSAACMVHLHYAHGTISSTSEHGIPHQHVLLCISSWNVSLIHLIMSLEPGMEQPILNLACSNLCGVSVPHIMSVLSFIPKFHTHESTRKFLVITIFYVLAS